MATTVRVYDETTSGERSNELTLDFLTEVVTVRELIRARVNQEVTEYNAKQPSRFSGLVQPVADERRLEVVDAARRDSVVHEDVLGGLHADPDSRIDGRIAPAHGHEVPSSLQRHAGHHIEGHRGLGSEADQLSARRSCDRRQPLQRRRPGGLPEPCSPKQFCRLSDGIL